MVIGINVSANLSSTISENKCLDSLFNSSLPKKTLSRFRFNPPHPPHKKNKQKLSRFPSNSSSCHPLLKQRNKTNYPLSFPIYYFLYQIYFHWILLFFKTNLSGIFRPFNVCFLLILSHLNNENYLGGFGHCLVV